MRYYHKQKNVNVPIFGTRYTCINSPVYFSCTLYKIGNRGLSVIQQRYDKDLKVFSWTYIDDWLANDIYTNPGFYDYFNKMSGVKDDKDLYPTVTVRQIMWALRMKPLKKERWETAFDRKFI